MHTWILNLIKFLHQLFSAKLTFAICSDMFFLIWVNYIMHELTGHTPCPPLPLRTPAPLTAPPTP